MALATSNFQGTTFRGRPKIGPNVRLLDLILTDQQLHLTATGATGYDN